MSASPAGLPRLHVVTDDGVLRAPGFVRAAIALLERHGPAVALHVRGPGLGGLALYDRARAVRPAAAAVGALLLVNDRLDVALALPAVGAQVGRRSLDVPDARGLLGARPLGYSAHGEAEALGALENGADFVVLGAVWATASHPGQPAAGPALLQRTRRRLESAGRAEAPLIAIGGITPERVRRALDAGASGVAVLSGVWAAADAAAAAGEYLAALGRPARGSAAAAAVYAGPSGAVQEAGES